MKIGIEAAHANKNHRTGVEEYSWQVIQHLKKVIPSNVEVVLYTNEKLKGELAVLPANWEEKVLPWFTNLPRRLNKGWSQIRLSLEFLSDPPDVFFAPAQVIPFITPAKTVVTIHDSAFLFQTKSYWFMSRWYLRIMNWLVIKKACKILTPSEFSKQELIKYYGVEAGEKAQVIPLGFDKENYNLEKVKNASQDEILKKYNITKKYIIAVNRLEEKKNTKRIVQAFNILRSSGLDIHLVLVGKCGVGSAEVLNEIEISPFADDIIVLGWVEKNTDVAVLVSGAQVFTVPSLYEGFGLPVLQAMALGCPVVASTGSSLEEVGASAGLYANPLDSADIAEKVIVLIKNLALRQEKIQLGLERVKNYSWEKTAEESWKQIKC